MAHAPGCDAKPILDILVGVQGWPPAAELRSALVSLGYEDLGEAGVPGRLYFRLRGNFDGDLWRWNLRVRDALRRDPELMREYVQEKRAAVRDGCTTLLAYSEHKSQFLAALAARVREAQG